MTDLLALTEAMPRHAFTRAETLIEEGDLPGRLLVLESGEVTVEHGGVPFARIDTAGAVFGEMSSVLARPATATVRATGDVVVRAVDDPLEFLTRHPGAALAVLRMTAARLDGLTHYLVDVKKQYADLDGHLGMVDDILDRLVHHQGPTVSTGSARDPEGDHEHGENPPG